MGDSDDEKKNLQDAEAKKFESLVPPYKLRHCDMPQKALKWAAIFAIEAFKKVELDKDVAVHIVKKVKMQSEFDEGDGEWQCIIGRNFAASLTFESKKLVFFDLLENGKSVLLFKAG